MKKIICSLFLFFITTNSLFSQEKQNDATWEETISFIEKHKNKLHFDKYLNVFGELMISRDEYTNRKYQKVTRFENQIESKKYLNVNMFYSNGRSHGGMTFYLLALFKAELNNNSFILFDSNGSKIYFNIYDAYFKERLFKAFSHLAYLAVEKKKKEIEKEKKNSGEKF